jgi:hypothetical protein
MINEEQDIYVACSVGDAYLYNSKTNKQFDIDAEFKIDLIKSVVFDEDDHMIYLACNRKEGVLGMFIIKFYQYDISDHEYILTRT